MKRRRLWWLAIPVGLLLAALWIAWAKPRPAASLIGGRFVGTYRPERGFRSAGLVYDVYAFKLSPAQLEKRAKGKIGPTDSVSDMFYTRESLVVLEGGRTRTMTNADVGFEPPWGESVILVQRNLNMTEKLVYAVRGLWR